ncbi:hypothetical protein IJ579_09540 [bacterium]|nr:hypothetical protein [bacterium]
MRVVVLGKGIMLANIVLGVLDAGADLVGVFRYEQTSRSRLKLLFEDYFKPASEVTLLKKLKAREIKMKSANDPRFRKLLIHLNVDLVIVGTWGEKIERETFNIPKIATLNVHPSLLPKYRGPNPYMQSILHGEEFSGVSIHLMNENFDSGAVLKQRKIKINSQDTSKELREKSVVAARNLVTEVIDDLNNKIITPVIQDDKFATYYPNITGEERMLDFKFQSSIDISRTIRALHPFLPCYISHGDNFFVVNPYKFNILSNFISAAPGSIIDKNSQKASLTIVCSDNKAIRFTDLKLYGSRNTKKYIEQLDLVPIK